MAVRQEKKQPVSLCVYSNDGQTVYQLADTKDWAVIFDDVLEVKAEDGVVYYWPLIQLIRWEILPRIRDADSH